MQEERTDATQKGAKWSNEQWGLHSIYSMPTSHLLYNQFLYNSSLAAHLLTVFKTITLNIKTTNHKGHNAAIAALYLHTFNIY